MSLASRWAEVRSFLLCKLVSDEKMPVLRFFILQINTSAPVSIAKPKEAKPARIVCRDHTFPLYRVLVLRGVPLQSRVSLFYQFP